VGEQVRVVVTSAAALDRETQSEHRLTVTAFDAGRPAPRTGQLDVTVMVLDANDNSPVFEHSEYEVSYSIIIIIVIIIFTLFKGLPPTNEVTSIQCELNALQKDK